VQSNLSDLLGPPCRPVAATAKDARQAKQVADLGDQLPVQTESGPVPTHHRFGRDHNKGLLPSGPKSTNGDPKELVEQA
jgi:hypothetical protein